MEKRRYLQEFTAVCRNCNGDGVKKTWALNDTLKQKPAVRSVCPVCEGSGMVKISGVRILTILPFKPQTLHKTVKQEIDELSVRDHLKKADEDMKRWLDVLTQEEEKKTVHTPDIVRAKFLGVKNQTKYINHFSSYNRDKAYNENCVDFLKKMEEENRLGELWDMINKEEFSDSLPKEDINHSEFNGEMSFVLFK